MRRYFADTRGQTFTLEGLVAGLILLTALMFAMQSVAVTPGAPGADVEPDVRQQAMDMLDVAEQQGTLSEMVRYFDNDSNATTFSGAENRNLGYGSDVPSTRFGDLVKWTFRDRGRVVNVLIEYRRVDDPGNVSEDIGTRTERLIYQGAPPEAAAVATTTITLYSNQTLTGPDGDGITLAEASERGFYPIPNIDPDGPLHNVVHVRVIVW